MAAKKFAASTRNAAQLRCAEKTPSNFSQFEDDEAWQIRSSEWAKKLNCRDVKRAKRERSREALVLSGNGVRLRVENGSLLVRNGFTC